MALVGLMDQHRGAFEYDWRTRFHLPLSAVGRSMSWGEALRLTKVLAEDPSSLIAAGMARWAYAMSRSDLALADLIDVTMAAHSERRPKPYPRPWDANKRRLGATSMDPVTARDALRRMARSD